MIRPEEWAVGSAVAVLAAVYVLSAMVFTPGVGTDAESAALYAVAGAALPVILLASWAAEGVPVLDSRDHSGHDA